jgi:hypothetical protein
MTALLEKAFARASDLPRDVQEQLARQMLQDIAGESKWNKTLAKSQKLLESMAAGARRAQRQGKIVKKGFDEL